MKRAAAGFCVRAAASGPVRGQPRSRWMCKVQHVCAAGDDQQHRSPLIFAPHQADACSLRYHHDLQPMKRPWVLLLSLLRRSGTLAALLHANGSSGIDICFCQVLL
jgi:hypothetical protein